MLRRKNRIKKLLILHQKTLSIAFVLFYKICKFFLYAFLKSGTHVIASFISRE